MNTRQSLRTAMMKILGMDRFNPGQKAEIWYTATPLQLMWMKFRKHRLAVISGVLLILMYLVSSFANFFAPYDPLERDMKHFFAPPQAIHFVTGQSGKWGFFVYAYKMQRDPKTLKPVYTFDQEQMSQVRLFVKGSSYKILNLFPTDWHFFGVEGEFIHLLGTDDLGRDVLSRIIHGGSISLFIGLIGVSLSFVLGCLLGGISGYYGGSIDTIIQRVIEFITSIPTIPLWMALTASLPQDWSAIKVYFAITVILALRGWAGLARVVRGQLLDLRNEDYVLAARLAGRRQLSIISWHLIPGVFSYLVVNITLSIPGMILGETALSFLGLGLRPPIVSWGVLLQQAQNIRTVSLYPWLMTPAIAVIIVVLCFNFLGDGLRDAADPYA